MTTRRRANPIDAYAKSVIAGTVPAGKFHRLACTRHLRDRSREGTRGFPYRLDLELAGRFFRFAGTVKHYKGRQWAGQRVELTPCQQFRLGSVFGWVHQTTRLRRFRTAYNEIPRKNGKTLEAAIVVVYGTFFDGEPGAEGYCTATKRDQAKIAFGDSKKLVLASAALKRRIGVHAWNLHQVSSDSKLEPLSSDYDSLDGLNPHIVIVDEFHAHKDRGMIDVLETAMGARLQPLMFQITTAGDDELSPCGHQHDYARKILEEAIADETFFAFIAHADDGDDPFSPRTWKKANPHYDVSVNPADMRALAKKARHMPTALAAFQQKRLNLWVNASSPWINMARWRAGQSAWSPADVAGRTCYAGVDLSSKTDLTAVVLVFPPEASGESWRLLPWFLTPADGLEERAQHARVPYGVWVKAGHLETNPGNRIDYARVKARILEAEATYDLQTIGLDPWNAGGLVTELQDELGEDRVVEVPQTFAQLTDPSKEFEAEVGAALMDAADHPLLTSHVSNAVVIRDANDNIRPTKKKSRGHIDGVIGSVIGVKLAQAADDGPAINPEVRVISW